MLKCAEKKQKHSNTNKTSHC